MNRSQVGYVANIETETLTSSNFRKVLFTGNNLQLVAMSLKPGEEIGMEVHDTHDQFFRIEQGRVKVIVNTEEHILEPDDVLIVPAGARHNVINVSDQDVRLYTIYAPPEHPDGTVQAEKPVSS